MLLQLPDQIPHPFYPSQFHLSILTGSIHTVNVCCSCMLNLNVTLRLLSLRLVGNHQNIHLTKTPILFWRFSLLVLWDISRLVVVHMYNAVSLFHLDIGISTKDRSIGDGRDNAL
jgi:hypothetical protein